MPRLQALRQYPMLVLYVDLHRSTEIATALGDYWVNFLSEFYQVIEGRVRVYESHGAHRHKFIGDAALVIFHPELAGEPAPDAELITTSRYAFEFVQYLNADIETWIANARGGRSLWSTRLDRHLRRRAPAIVASLSMGPVTPFEEPARPDREGRRHEMAGTAIHRAQRLTGVHELLSANNLFVTADCYERLLPIQRTRLPFVTDLELRPHPERVHSGRV